MVQVLLMAKNELGGSRWAKKARVLFCPSGKSDPEREMRQKKKTWSSFFSVGTMIRGSYLGKKGHGPVFSKWEH